MKTWTRAVVPTLCGGCDALVGNNLPLLAISLPGVKRVRYRCQGCAGQAPPDLPFRQEPAPVAQRTKRMTPISRLANVKDFKSAQSGE